MDKLKGIFIGVFLVMLGYGAILTYAAWNTDLTVSSGDALTSTKWNNVIDNIETNSGTIAALSGGSSVFTQSGTTAYYVDGNVGIGVLNPDNDGVQSNFTLMEISSIGDPELVLSRTIAHDGWGVGDIIFKKNDNNAGDKVIALIQAAASGNGNNAGGYLSFYTKKDTVSNVSSRPVERVRIENNGNVGIGTTTPSAKLHIVGDGASGIIIDDGATVDGLGITTLASGSNRFLIKTRDDVERLVIQQETGNVGIGTISPSEKLDVNGYVKSIASAFFVSISTHASAPEYISWDIISHNTGNNYNPSNGIFTAPVNGIYQFCWGGINNPAATISRTYLYKNGANYAGEATQLRLDSGGNYGDGGNCATIPLAENDWVAIYLGSGGFYRSYGYFTGHLIVAQ